jgi:hypothetical protein
LPRYRWRRLADGGKTNDVLVADNDWSAAIDHRAHGELRLVGNSDLAHQNEVERRVQLGRHFRSDRHPAAGEREHHRLLVPVLRERCRELAPGFLPILESHR